MEISLVHQGEENEPVLVIDNLVDDPGALIEEAARARFSVTAPHYPGVRADIGRDYFRGLLQALLDPVCDAFGFSRGITVDGGWFSLVTTRPEKLTPFQRLPHFDGLNRNSLAVLHYLGTPDKGGTAFYRHRATGFETLSDARFGIYRPKLEAEIRAAGLPAARYFNGSDAHFDEVARYEARANRTLVYRGCTLHSGVIPEDFDFSADPRQGRLTINTFIRGLS